MSAHKDGGPAFPQPLFKQNDGFTTNPSDGYGLGGMTLRDYFAGQALVGFSSEEMLRGFSAEGRARLAYEAADEMLKERDKWKSAGIESGSTEKEADQGRQ